MKHFTPETMRPRESTLELIRKIAHTYRVIKMADGTCLPLCLN